MRLGKNMSLARGDSAPSGPAPLSAVVGASGGLITLTYAEDMSDNGAGSVITVAWSGGGSSTAQYYGGDSQPAMTIRLDGAPIPASATGVSVTVPAGTFTYTGGTNAASTTTATNGSLLTRAYDAPAGLVEDIARIDDRNGEGPQLATQGGEQGANGGYLLFDGAANYLTRAEGNANFYAGNFTMTFRVRNQPSVGTGQRGIWQQTGTFQWFAIREFIASPASDNVVVAMGGSNGSINVSGITPGTPFNITVVGRFADNAFDYYLNGTLVGSTSAYAQVCTGIVQTGRFNSGGYFDDGLQWCERFYAGVLTGNDLTDVLTRAA